METLLERIAQDRKAMYADQQALVGPLSLHEAIARALKYNFDHRLSIMEFVLQQKQLDAASLNMLPKLAASAGYTWRSNPLASFSVPVAGSPNQGTFVTSQDREKSIASLSFSWNILDFGVSYYQAKQQADRVLIAQERRRRVVNNIIREVSAVYWRAVTAERLVPDIERCLLDAERALESNRAVERQRLRPILQTLQYRKDLLKIMGQLRELTSDLRMAKTQLAALVNVPIHMDFSVALPDTSQLEPPRIEADIETLETIALYNRPDLRELAYQERIDRNEVHKEMLRMLPGITLSSSGSYDSNSFFLNSSWIDAAGRVTYNLFDLIKGPQKVKVARTRVELGEMRRLALSMAAIVQVNLAYQQYSRAVQSYANAAQLNEVEKSLQKAAVDASALKARSELELISQSAETIAARLERDLSVAGIMGALGNLYISLGCDPYDGPLGQEVALDSLSQQIKVKLEPWQMGRIVRFQALVLPQEAPDEAGDEKAAVPAVDEVGGGE